jgi:hypothetical protein
LTQSLLAPRGESLDTMRGFLLAGSTMWAEFLVSWWFRHWVDVMVVVALLIVMAIGAANFGHAIVR